jgi:hypothetical protein
MFNLTVDDRLSSWAALRRQIETADNPFDLVSEFWQPAPFVPYNKQINPHNPKSWPTPWEIIVENHYDDFTKALMMAYSIKFTKRFKDSTVDIRICLDKIKNTYYNIVCIDNKTAINYQDFEATPWESLPDSFSMENLIEVQPSG